MEAVKIHRNIAKLKDIDMFYFDTKTEGPIILCLHGRYGRAETWYDFIDHYSKQYRIIAPDQRGHGLSSKPLSEYTAKEMTGDIIELLDQLNIDSVILVGHSMGGTVAGYLASEYPEYIKSVAILDKSATGPEPNNQPLDISQLHDPVTKDWPLPFVTLNQAMTFIKQVTESDLEYQYFMNSLEETNYGYQMMFSPKAMAINIANYQGWFHLLPNIKCLALLIRASGNNAVSDEDLIKMQSLIPNCLAYDMSHPDHNVHLGYKEEFYKYFDEFLAKTQSI